MDSFEYRRGITVLRRNTGHDDVPHRPIASELVALVAGRVLRRLGVGSAPRGRRPDGEPSSTARAAWLPLVTWHAVCRWAKEPPVLDGKLDDSCWQTAAVIDHFATFWAVPKSPRKGNLAYLVWDDDAFHYASSMTDAELRAFGNRRNDSL